MLKRLYVISPYITIICIYKSLLSISNHWTPFYIIVCSPPFIIHKHTDSTSKEDTSGARAITTSRWMPSQLLRNGCFGKTPHSLLLLGIMLHCMEYLFSQFRSVVPPASPPSLLAGLCRVGNREGLNAVQAVFRSSLNIGEFSPLFWSQI